VRLPLAVRFLYQFLLLELLMPKTKKKPTTKPQDQHPVKVTLLNGTTAEAIATGNNAAWHCPCGRKLPLVGYSDAEASDLLYTHIVCPACGRTYKVIGTAKRAKATAVKEIKPVVR
jgi:hypothetical protein